MTPTRPLHSLTVVAPFYNEETNVNAFYEALRSATAALPASVDFVFVDDGSHDRTLEYLNRIADQDAQVSVLALARNFGHQAALTAGMDCAQGEAVVVMDSDLQHPPSLIAQMVAQYERGFDVVYAARAEARALSLSKRLTTRLYYGLLKQTTRIEIVEGAADFRLMARPVVEALRGMRETHRYLRGMVPWLGFRSTVIRYDQPDRHSGQPSYTFWKSLRLARHGFFSFSTVPLELITWTGLALTALAAIYLIYIIGVALAGKAVPGWSSLIVAVLIIGGVQLISIGVIAQYVGMIFEEVKQRPLYVLKQKRLSATSAHAPLEVELDT